jgi:hypothetical protein
MTDEVRNAQFLLTDEDGLVFDEYPSLFVRADQDPIVWTVRGLAYFAPRFRRIGVSIDRVNSPQEFATAYKTWLDLEKVLVLERVKRASQCGSKEHQILQAILEGNTARAAYLQGVRPSVVPLPRRPRQ